MNREQRLVRNSAMFRGVNERIREGAAEAEFAGPTFFICECGDIACGETIEVRLDQYGHARKRTTTFLVAPGHQGPYLERVLSENGRFAPVEMMSATPATTAGRFAPKS